MQREISKIHHAAPYLSSEISEQCSQLFSNLWHVDISCCISKFPSISPPSTHQGHQSSYPPISSRPFVRVTSTFSVTLRHHQWMPRSWCEPCWRWILEGLEFLLLNREWWKDDMKWWLTWVSLSSCCLNLLPQRFWFCHVQPVWFYEQLLLRLEKMCQRWPYMWNHAEWWTAPNTNVQIVWNVFRHCPVAVASTKAVYQPGSQIWSEFSTHPIDRKFTISWATPITSYKYLQVCKYVKNSLPTYRINN